MAGFDLDFLRAQLGFGPSEGESWFSVDPRVCGFGVHKKRKRAVVLREWGHGALAVVFARTTQQDSKSAPSPAHSHRSEFPACWLDMDAWIVTRLPLPVAKKELVQKNRMCTEPHQQTVEAVLAAPSRTCR